MKRLFIFIILLLPAILRAQVATLVPPTNNSYAGLEKNMLFYANTRYGTSQTGSAQLNLRQLFDGRYEPSYTGAPSASDPTVVLIENLPAVHTQKLAYIGWTTRYYPPTRFRIEGYDTYVTTGWRTLADVTGYSGTEYTIALSGNFTKLRYTFYDGTGPQGQLGISELYFLHGEFVQAYDGLMVRYDDANNVTMGYNYRPSNLSVNGNITTKKVKVTQTGWSDFVFDSAYQLPHIPYVEKYIQANKHLPEIPSAADVAENGVDLGNISAKLLQKIEELTLYIIDQHKKTEALQAENKALNNRILQLEEHLKK